MLRKASWVKPLGIAVVALLAVGFVGTRIASASNGSSGSGGNYRLRIAMSDASEVYKGMPAWVSGLDAGKVSGIAAQGDSAMVTVTLNAAHTPLHAGTKAYVAWKSLLGERYVSLTPGPTANPALPTGSLIESDDQVTVQDLLNALNPATRTALASSIREIQQAFSGHGQDLNATLQTAAPTVQALTDILDAVGQDGPALDQVVTKLHQVASALASRQGDLSSTVSNLDQLTTATGTQQQQLTAALQQLPSTLTVAKSTLDVVPNATNAVDPLLQNLQPAVQQLPQTAANLSPVLSELQPTLPLLDQTLQSANGLLQETPTLLDSANAVLPGVTQAVTTLLPAFAFLRPYTPEIAGGLDVYGDTYSRYDANGHYQNVNVVLGPAAIGNLPAGLFPLLPGSGTRPAPLPGQNANQTWTDAEGNTPQ